MSQAFPTPLSSPRLLLRRLREDDAEALCGYRSLPEVARLQGWESFGPDDAARLIESQRNSEPGVPGTWFQLAIIEKSTGSMLGDCGLHCRQDDPRQMEIGITLAPSHQGRGYATEALECLLDFVFGTLGKHRVSAVTAAENGAAASLFRRLGFRQEAHFVEHRWYKGYWDSEFVFGLLRREWESRAQIRIERNPARINLDKTFTRVSPQTKDLGRSTMEIRETTEADAGRIAALIDSVARERRYLAGTVGFPVDSTRAFIASVKAAGGVHVVAVISGEVIGWCDIVPHPFEGMKHVGRLGMGVQQDHRSKGVGQGLLSAAVQKAFAGAIERIELEVFASNCSAVSLYEAFGFECEGRKKAARRLDGVTDDILVYAMRKAA